MSRRSGASRQARPAGSGKLKAFVAGLVTGFVIALGLVWLGLFDKSREAVEPKASAEGQSAAKTSSVRTQTKFDFYTVLPEQEVEVVVADPAAGKTAENQATTVPPPAVVEPVPAPVAEGEKAAPIVDLSVRAETAPSVAKPAPKAVNEAATKVTKFLQAGSFSRQSDADKRRAELLIHGFRASTDVVKANGETRYRVQIGPFSTDAEVNKARANLKANGIDTFVTSRK